MSFRSLLIKGKSNQIDCRKNNAMLNINQQCTPIQHDDGHINDMSKQINIDIISQILLPLSPTSIHLLKTKHYFTIIVFSNYIKFGDKIGKLEIC